MNGEIIWVGGDPINLRYPPRPLPLVRSNGFVSTGGLLSEITAVSPAVFVRAGSYIE